MTYLNNLMEYIDTELAPLLRESAPRLRESDCNLYKSFKNTFKNKPDDFYKAKCVYLNFYFNAKEYIPILDISENETADDIDMQMNHVHNLLSKKLSHLFTKDEYCIEFGITDKDYRARRTYYTKKLTTKDAKELIKSLLTRMSITDDVLEKYY